VIADFLEINGVLKSGLKDKKLAPPTQRRIALRQNVHSIYAAAAPTSAAPFFDSSDKAC
jgi:hypothetical protein